MNRNEIAATRTDHFLAADKLVKEARASGKDLQGAELEKYEHHIAEIKKLDALIARYEGGVKPKLVDLSMMGHVEYDSHGQPIDPTCEPHFIPVPFAGGAAQANEPQWTDPRTGQPIRVLRPDQPMSARADFADYEAPLSLGKFLSGIVTGRWTGAEREMQAMSEGSLGGGGYLLPSPLSGQIIDKVRNAAVMIRAGALTVPMDTATLSMGRIAQDVTPVWHTEAAAITASDMAFEKVTFTCQTLAALCSMSVEMFEDVSNIDAIVMDAISKVLALELDRACLLGSGTAPEPRGLRNQANVVIDNTTFTTNGSAISTSAPTGAVAWDWLAKQVSAIWGVNENPNAAIYSARTAGELDLLRATTGEVLPPPGSVGKLQLLFTNAIPNNLTQGSNSDCSDAFVGDFSQAMIGMRHGVILEVSRYGNVGSTSMFSTLQVGIRAYLRSDFQLARPAAFRVVTGIR